MGTGHDEETVPDRAEPDDGSHLWAAPARGVSQEEVVMGRFCTFLGVAGMGLATVFASRHHAWKGRGCVDHVRAGGCRGVCSWTKDRENPGLGKPQTQAFPPGRGDRRRQRDPAVR